MVLSGYIVNLVDGRPWKSEAAGSNPATQTTNTSRLTFGEVRRLSTYSDGFDSRTRYQTWSLFPSAVCKIVALIEGWTGGWFDSFRLHQVLGYMQQIPT